MPPFGIASIALRIRFIKAPRMEDSSIIAEAGCSLSERRTSILFAIICGRSNSSTSLTIWLRFPERRVRVTGRAKPRISLDRTVQDD